MLPVSVPAALWCKLETVGNKSPVLNSHRDQLDATMAGIVQFVAAFC
jgi:hypothetical protein